MNYQYLPRDREVWNILQREQLRQSEEIELIASENYASAAVLEALGSVFNDKYSEGYSGQRYYGGNEIVDQLENLAVDRAKRLFQAEHVNVQPLSGSPANAAVYMAFLQPGDKVLGLKLDHGGHLSHGHKVNFSGRLYQFVQYPLQVDTGLLDMELIAKIARQEKPKMIVAGFTSYSREIDWAAFQSIADEVGAYTFADISHTAGLIAAGCLANPVKLFDVTATTTHKTLRGPRGAIIMCRQEFAKQVDRAVFPGMQGGPHDHVTAAKAVAFEEALSPGFKQYARQIINNARAMAEEFIKRGYKIISQGTDNHLFVLDLSTLGIGGREAEELLDQAGISVSRSTIPNDPRPPLNPSGLRLGTPAMTTRGMKEEEARLIASYIDELLVNHSDQNQPVKIKAAVKELAKKFTVPAGRV